MGTNQYITASEIAALTTASSSSTANSISFNDNGDGTYSFIDQTSNRTITFMSADRFKISKSDDSITVTMPDGTSFDIESKSFDMDALPDNSDWTAGDTLLKENAAGTEQEADSDTYIANLVQNGPLTTAALKTELGTDSLNVANGQVTHKAVDGKTTSFTLGDSLTNEGNGTYKVTRADGTSFDIESKSFDMDALPDNSDWTAGDTLLKENAAGTKQETDSDTYIANLVQNGPLTTAALKAELEKLNSRIPTSPNLIKNALMNELTDSFIRTPIGFGEIGARIEAVHPYTQAFEGIYAPTKPGNAASSPELANANAPYWFGPEDTGPRLNQSSLLPFTTGKKFEHANILKITASMSASSTNERLITFTSKRIIQRESIGFRAFIKIVKGSKLSFGEGTNSLERQNCINIPKSKTDTGPQGWFFMDVIAPAKRSLDAFHQIFLGFPDKEEIEAYLALPYAYAPYTTDFGFSE